MTETGTSIFRINDLTQKARAIAIYNYLTSSCDGIDVIAGAMVLMDSMEIEFNEDGTPYDQGE